MKKQKSTKFKHVKRVLDIKGNEQWIISIRNVDVKYYNTEREAAIAVDKYLLNKGKPAINILKPKL